MCLVLNWVGLLLLLRWWIQFVATSCPLLQSEEASDRLLVIKSWKFGVVPFSVLMLDKAFASLSVFTLGYCSLGCFWSVSFEFLYPKRAFLLYATSIMLVTLYPCNKNFKNYDHCHFMCVKRTVGWPLATISFSSLLWSQCSFQGFPFLGGIQNPAHTYWERENVVLGGGRCALSNWHLRVLLGRVRVNFSKVHRFAAEF